MVLALIVTIVGVSAAWFGDVKHVETANKEQLKISSNRPAGVATINLTSANRLNAGTADLIPAKAVNGWLLDSTNAAIGTGATLYTANAGAGIQTAATKASIYFPFSYGGTADEGVADGKKAVRIFIDTAKIKIGETTVGETVTPVLDSVNYLDEFYITFTVLSSITTDQNTGAYVSSVVATSATASKSGNTITFTGLNPNDNSLYFVSDLSNKSLYLLLPPDATYYVRVDISYDKVDELLNPATIYKTISFGVNIQTIERPDFLTAIDPLVV